MENLFFLTYSLLLRGAPSAYCLLLTRRAIRLRRVVKLPRLDDVFFVIDNAVAIHIDAYLYLMLLAVVYVAGVKSQAVLAAQERIDRAQNGRQFAGKCNRVIRSAGLFGKCSQRVLGLEKGHSSGHPADTVGCRKVRLILLIEKFGRPNYVDRNTGILRDFPGVAIVDFAECIDA